MGSRSARLARELASIAGWWGWDEWGQGGFLWGGVVPELAIEKVCVADSQVHLYIWLGGWLGNWLLAS